MVFVPNPDILRLIIYNHVLQKSSSRIAFFTIFAPPGPLLEASFMERFRKTYAFDIRKMYKMAISRPFLMLIFKPLYCKILLLALVFSLFSDRQKSSFLIIFGPKIVSRASVAVGHPLLVLCFLYSGEPFPPRSIFGHFCTFFPFFHVFA